MGLGEHLEKRGAGGTLGRPSTAGSSLKEDSRTSAIKTGSAQENMASHLKGLLCSDMEILIILTSIRVPLPVPHVRDCVRCFPNNCHLQQPTGLPPREDGDPSNEQMGS